MQPPARTSSQDNQTVPTHTRPGQPLPWITVKDTLWMLYLYPGRWLSRTSIPIPHLLLSIAESVFQVLSAPRKGEVIRNLAAAFGPETPPSVLRSIARAYIANAVRRAIDDLALEQGNAVVRCRSFRGRQHLDAALAAGNGVLLASLHWYADRTARRYLETAGYPIMSVRNHEPPDKHMGLLGRKFLQPRYVHFLHEVIRDEVFIQDRQCSLKILGRLRSGGIVNIHLDAPFSRHLIERPFLGVARRFPTGAFHLARVSGCAILPMLTLGRAQSLEIQIERPLPLDRSLPTEEFCQAHLTALVDILESHVLEHPDQWELWTRL